MAAPTPDILTRQIGHRGVVSWQAEWGDGNGLTATKVIDLSALGDGYTNSLAIERIAYACSAGISFALDFDATSNQFIHGSVLGSTDFVDIDYTWHGRGGIQKTAAGSTGDLILTTDSQAAGDEISLTVWFRCS